MKKVSIALAWLLLSLNAFADDAGWRVTVPVMTNTPGQFGAYFKSRVSIFNPTIYAYPIDVALYRSDGVIKRATINMSAGQVRNFDNFLETIFSETGAAAARFDSTVPPNGKTDYKFIVTSEVYTESSTGTYTTPVPSTTRLHEIESTHSYNLGINVNSSTRCNVGCFNDSSSPKTLIADVYNSSGQLVDTVTLDMQGSSWKQVGMATAVTGGYIRWRPLKDAYCYAVVVNNASNDGTFIPTQEYLP